MQRCGSGCGRWVTHSAGDTCLTCERANRPEPHSTMTPCPRCAGAGRIRPQRHLDGGRCGLCRGTGLVGAGKAVEERLRQDAAEERLRCNAARRPLPLPESSAPGPATHACRHCGECFPTWFEKFEHRCAMAPPPVELVPKASYEDVTSGDGEPGYWHIRPERKPRS